MYVHKDIMFFLIHMTLFHINFNLIIFVIILLYVINYF